MSRLSIEANARRSLDLDLASARFDQHLAAEFYKTARAARDAGQADRALLYQGAAADLAADTRRFLGIEPED